jgi:23S rRNA (adenine2030-N6)-methyltransferase
MNYRHIYHAGNFGDVFKHSILTLLIQNLLRKNTPFCYLDTHAGIGVYNLLSVLAQKTMEYESGIAKLLKCDSYPKELNIYLDIVKKLNINKKSSYYPGSPYIARSLLRPIDRMILLELHHEDIFTLKQNFFDNKQVAVHYYDGYQGLKAFLPPKERRGLVLIDPPFEQPDEFDRIIAGLKVALTRWVTGIYAIWYPIKDLSAVNKFKCDLNNLGIKKLLSTELIIEKSNATSNIFRGCGMAIINPPWKFDQLMMRVVNWLQDVLSVIE